MVQPTSIFFRGATQEGHFIEAFSAQEAVKNRPTNIDWVFSTGATRQGDLVETFSLLGKRYKVVQLTSTSFFQGCNPAKLLYRGILWSGVGKK